MAKGKYAAALAKTPHAFGTAPDYQEKVNELKVRVASDSDFEMKSSSLAREYAAIRDEKDKATEVLSEINLRLTAFTQLLIERMQADGLSSLKLDTGRAVSTWTEPRASVQDKEAFRLWCLKQGLERSMTLHPATMQSLVNQRLVDGEPEPPGISIWAQDIIRLGSER